MSISDRSPDKSTGPKARKGGGPGGLPPNPKGVNPIHSP